MSVNHDLLERTLRRIEANPKGFNMASWADVGDCGTTACFAGHAMLESGYRLNQYNMYTYSRPDGAEVVDELDEAQALLGFTDYQARRLFFNDVDTPARLRALVEGVLSVTEEAKERTSK